VDFAGKRIATAYPGLLQRELVKAGVTAEIVKLDGAVENAVALGVADGVADVVDTGSTLRKANLEVIGEPLLDSEAVLITRAGNEPDPAATVFIRRLQGVIVARSYVMLDYDIKAADLDAASKLTPGLESPTVSPLREQGWFAVRAMVERSTVHSTMDELYTLGARGIIVTDISACRL
jgi:ATP phosphoribosyltransferase